jgi:hypothetical protein
MKNSIRLLLVASVSAIGLAFAGSALAAYNPFLTVQQTSSKAGAGTTVGFVIGEGQDEDATAKATIFSPAGYANTLTQAPGTTIGKAFAYVKAGALGGAILPLSGPVVVGDPTSATIKAASVQCRGVGKDTNTAVWVLNTSLQGQTISIPDFVNVAGPYVTQEICLPAPPNATFQAQLIVANFSVKGVFTNGAAGGYQWDGAFTPYAGTTPNAGATTEWRTYQGIPSSLTFKRVKSKPSVVTFSGRLAVGGINPAGIQPHLYKALKPLPAPNFTTPSLNGLFGVGKPVLTKKLKANGKYTITRPKVKKKTYFQMRLEDYGFQGCDGPSPTGLPLPCAGTDLAPITSAQVKVLPPPKKKKHKH